MWLEFVQLLLKVACSAGQTVIIPKLSIQTASSSSSHYIVILKYLYPLFQIAGNISL